VLLAATLLILLAAVKWYAGRTETPVIERSAVVATMSGALPAPSSAVLAMASAPVVVESALSASGVSGSSQPEALRGKPLLEVKSEEEPAAAPVAKKTARHKLKQTGVQGAERSENLPAQGREEGPLKTITPQQRAESEFGKANLAAQEGRTNDALAGYEAALLIDSSHKEARRAWVGLLLGLKRNDDAERVLQRGLKRDPHDTSFAMLLARLQVERNAVPLALETLQKTLPYAEEQADYQAFVAALLQRQGRNDEAIAHYQVALRLAPNNGIWLMGMGISLQAAQRTEDARAAYQRALASNSLNAQLQAFVQQKLKEL
ncbi:MAG TPA: tetratricopeptide repeat protein, partial [Sideroxyarcus sp.]|nr:tetratricopeptide repeat protein [Sideroxyarcus sp.]